MREPAVTLGAAVPRVKPRPPEEVRDPYDGLRPWSGHYPRHRRGAGGDRHSAAGGTLPVEGTGSTPWCF